MTEKEIRDHVIAHFAPPYVLYLIFRDARAFLRDASGPIQYGTAEDVALCCRVFRRIVWLAASVTVAGCVVAPCSAPWLAVWLHGIAPADAAFRMLLGLGLSIALSPLYLLSGACVGCLTAPTRFLTGPAGMKWMDALGRTRNITNHRVFCVLGALMGFGVMAGMGFMLIYMAPTVK